MKIIFLDIDGVMNSHRHYELTRENRPEVPLKYRYLYPLYPRMSRFNFCDPEAIAALNRIVEATGARIVISSSWRDWGIENLDPHLRWQGYSGPPLLDRTPREELVNKDSPILISKGRGHEIDWWLKHDAKEPVEAFVILDDDADMDMHQPKLVQTQFETGLTMADAERAIEMLKEEP